VDLDATIGAFLCRTMSAHAQKRVIRQRNKPGKNNILADPLRFRVTIDNAVIDCF
jgi:hypothetical protein